MIAVPMKRFLQTFGELIRRPRAQASASVLFGTVIGALASFIAAMVAVRTLSVDGFAAFGVGIAVNSLTMQFADLGLGTVAMAEAAEATGPHEARNRLLRLAIRRLATAVGSGVLIAVAVIFIPSLEPYREVALIAVGGGVLGCISLFTVGALQAFRRFGMAGAVQVTIGIARLTLVVAAAVVGLGAPAMMVGYGVIAPVIGAVLGAWVLIRHSESELEKVPPDPVVEAELEFEDREEGPDGRYRRTRRRYIAIMSVFAALLINGDVLLLTLVGTQSDVASYSAAWRFAAGLLLLNAALSSSTLPFVLASGDPWKEALKLTKLGTGIAVVQLIFVVPLTFIGVAVLGSAGDDAMKPLAVLLVAFSLEAFIFITHQVFYRIRRERFLAWMTGVELLVMAGVTLLLRSHGAMAPAFGQLAARVVVIGISMAPVVLQATGRINWFETDIEEQV